MTILRRGDRVAREIRDELCRLVRDEIRDPRVRDITITRVEVTDDLREARAYFVPLGGVGNSERIGELEKGLSAALPFLQRKTGRNLRLRYTPRLRFLYDKGVDNLVRVHDLLEGGPPSVDSGDE